MTPGRLKIWNEDAGAWQYTPGGGSQPGAMASADFLFTEQTTAGTYTATFPVPARTLIANIGGYVLGTAGNNLNGWAADTAAFTMGDSVNVDGYAAAMDFVSAYGLTLYDPLNEPGDAVDGSGFMGQATGLQGLYSASGSPLSLFGEGNQGGGILYQASDTITMTMVTTIGSPPVVPVGILLVRIWYQPPVTATDAAFS